MFTEDGRLATYISSELFADLKSRAKIVETFTQYLANFNAVYHLNGQLSLESDGKAQAINHCHVVSIEEKDSKTLIHNHYVRYNDSYVKQGGKWLIKRRIANFMVSNSREMV